MADGPRNTKKHEDFVKGPVGKKTVDALPGVGKANAKLLEEKGFTKASHVLSTFISKEVDKDRAKFKDAIQPYSGLNARQYDQLYKGLDAYTGQNM
ncbi:unnamed protein product [Lymnaea stagnalis]|uniref:Uncharacterized protein n=1 Tax=Lymnaea stagnalis TaxID=6523 RepID=A0AAV2H5M8_LYMST